MDVNFRGYSASPLLGTPQGLSVFVDGVRVNESFGDTVN
jgi:iron complex outermembrane receptor protein